jgi:c-di-AMP phosphodiesterase-like protein
MQMTKPIPVTFKSKDANVHGLFYKAAGAGPFSTVVDAEILQRAIQKRFEIFSRIS